MPMADLTISVPAQFEHDPFPARSDQDPVVLAKLVGVQLTAIHLTTFEELTLHPPSAIRKPNALRVDSRLVCQLLDRQALYTQP
jgi:hypothetical protein